jgi:nucleotide-binding universal stress UspA family protein
MFKRILVPLDGSLLAKMALDVATRLVDSTCEITLVNAVQDSEILNYPGSPMNLNPEYYPTLETLENNGKRYLEEVADSLRKQGYHVNTIVEVGDAAECVIYTAAKRQVEAIVMSTHGRSGVSRLLFGSVTSRVLSRATCPVLVVPSQETQQKHEQKLTEINFA